VQAIDPGFRPENVLVVRLNPSPSIGAGARSAQLRFTAQEAVLSETLTRIRAIPGVLAAGASGELMMIGEPDESITLDGEPYDANAHRSVRLTSIGVSPGFFEAIGVPFGSGRFLTRDDGLMKLQLLFTPMTLSYRGTAEAALVNESFVKQFLTGKDPIGTRFWTGSPSKPYWYEVVGVVGDMQPLQDIRNAGQIVCMAWQERVRLVLCLCHDEPGDRPGTADGAMTHRIPLHDR
jgi:putative ABC transport system permease protein